MKLTSIWYNCYRFIKRSFLAVIAMGLMTTSLLGFSKPGNAQSILNQPVSLTLRDQRLKDAFDQLQKQTHIIFLYSDMDQLDRKVSIHATNELLQKVLDHLLLPAGLGYEVAGGKILISKGPSKPVKKMMLHGRVVDQENKPLPGVSVKVKGTQTVTLTNTDGKFSLPVNNEKETLVFSYIGFLTKELKVKTGDDINIVMETNPKSLDEVVVVGYGTQLKEKITGSIATISGADIQKAQVGTFTEGMVGKLPGVQISQVTGDPGAAPSIRIRGTGSITAGNEPLYVVDGFPLGDAALSNFNMGDIESVSVLKDASATSIYGSRGANGVIIVTTKHGEAGKPKVSLNSYFGVQQITKKLDLLSPDEFADFAIEARNNAWEYLGGKASDPNSVRSPLYQISPYFLDKSSWDVTDWQDEIFQIAPTTDHELSIAGGSEAVKYMISGGYYGQDGIIKNSYFRRYSLRSNIDAHPFKRLHITGTMNTTVVNNKKAEDEGQFNDGIIGSMINTPGIYGTSNPDGSYPSFWGFGYGVSEVQNPMAFINEYDDRTNQFRTIANVAAELELAHGLTFKSMIGFDYNLSRNNSFTNSFINDVPANPGQVREATDASGSYSSTSDFNWLSENTLHYDFNLGSKHSFETLVGFTAQKDYIEEVGISATNFPNNLVPTLNAGQISGASTTRAEWALLSYLARANYSYDNKYYATATVRTDGSSRFGADKRWGLFPSLSLGWMLSNESFFDVPWINFLKFRASYGLSGNNDISNYGSIGLLSYNDYTIGGKLVSGISPSTLTNQNLGWERSKQTDAGIDVGMFHNRVNLVVDAYQRINTDLLLDVSVPSILGLTNSLQNIGKVRNRGLEVSVDTKNITGKFSWSTNFNFSINRNIVLALGPEGDPIISASNGDSHITQIGQPIGNFYGYIFDGVYNTQEEINNHAHLDTDAPGEPIVRDVNGDGKITTDDRTILGNYQPDFIYGFGNNFSYGNFDLSFMVQGVQGSEIMDLGMRQSLSLTGRTNNLGIARDRWISPEQPGNGKVFRAITDVRGVRRDASSFYMEDGSYLRVRNIMLGYNFPVNIIHHIGLSALRIYFSAQNPFTFTNHYLGYNPEVSSYHNALTPGVDYFNYPLAKSYTIGLNLTL